MEAHSDATDELRAVSRRLVLGADGELQALERELHGGLQQHLVALSVGLQLARSLAQVDPAAAASQLEDAERDLRLAVDAAGRLAHRIYAPVGDAGGLGPALRAAAVNAHVASVVEVEADGTYPPEVVRTVYLCWLDALGRVDPAVRTTISVREDGDELVFDVVAPAGGEATQAPLRDRVEALGGRLTIAPERDGVARVCGSLPLRV